MNSRHVAAIDLGASSGRVMLATYQENGQKLDLKEIHRFTNQLKQVGKSFYWDLDSIEAQIRVGLDKITAQQIKLDSIGIDTWGVDYVLLDEKGQVVAPTYSYRDHRTDNVMERVCHDLGKKSIYEKTGIQFLSFNTLYQLKAMMDEKPQYLDKVAHLLLIPDYLIYRLTGELNCEYTNATTTQLVNVQTKDWDKDLLDYLGVPRSWFGNITQPGNRVGYWTSKQGHKVPVIAVASHDTASAVIASPLIGDKEVYLCSGTWSLMGLESPKALTGENALAHNITNEGGVFGRYRVLKNIMGLWLFQRVCHENNINDIPSLIEQLKQESGYQGFIDPNDERFLNPKSMTDTIKLVCQESNQQIPQTNPQLARCIFNSLATLYGEIVNELSSLIGQKIEQLHIVGGGCQNHFLNQLCADICKISVTAGPIEASALGNVGIQLISLGSVANVTDLRQLICANFSVQTFISQ